MAATKSKEITNEVIFDRLREFEDKFLVMFDTFNLKLETISLTSPPAAKRTVAKKFTKTEAARVDKPPANAMYWWRKMYATESDLIKTLYTDEDITTAEASCTNIKAKATDYDKRCAIGQSIYSTFDDGKKKQIKGMFQTWKKEQAKSEIQTVEKEASTDDEKKSDTDEKQNDNDSTKEGTDKVTTKKPVTKKKPVKGKKDDDEKDMKN